VILLVALASAAGDVYDMSLDRKDSHVTAARTEDIELYSSLGGQSALVTGANRGIGEVIAERLADLGATVYAGARDPDEITAADQQPVELDITEESEIREAVEQIDDRSGGLDILVNNAGVFWRAGPLHRTDSDVIRETLAVNLEGSMLVTKHCLPLLLAEEGSRVITLSSDLAQFADGKMGGEYPAYRVSKVGLGGLTAYLHAEYAQEGLIANAVTPGWTRTDMGGENAPRTPAEGADTAVWLARFRPGSPGGQFWKDRARIEW